MILTKMTMMTELPFFKINDFVKLTGVPTKFKVIKILKGTIVRNGDTNFYYVLEDVKTKKIFSRYNRRIDGNDYLVNECWIRELPKYKKVVKKKEKIKYEYKW